LNIGRIKLKMKVQTKTIVLVLRSGGDFSFRDVELIARHINGKWKSDIRPRIICLWDKASEVYDLGNIELIPLTNNLPGTWSRMELYSPEMEQYRPFLYIDLDTVIIRSVEDIFNLVRDQSMFITLEDFWQMGKMATGLVWFPAKSEKISKVWEAWKKTKPEGNRMDYFLRNVIVPDAYWQHLTHSIVDFKPKTGKVLMTVPEDAAMICFHGKPRIHDAAYASISISWVRDYVETVYGAFVTRKRVTVIIPYKIDRGWLKQAINSVPGWVQLIVSQGEGNWPANFNKVLPQVTGDYIKYLHEDDMLTVNSIIDSVKAIEDQGVDFIHGEAVEIWEGSTKQYHYKSPTPKVTLEQLLKKNTIHSATLMYRREVFEKLGGFDESLNTAEEYEFNLRCLQAGLKIGYCNSPLAFYRRHATQKVRTVSKAAKTKEREMVKDMYK